MLRGAKPVLRAAHGEPACSLVALTGMAGKLAAETIAGQAERFDLLARIRHRPFPGGALMRMPALVLGMLYYRLRDIW